jgi:formate--tetrahydrofolate ligase
MRLIPIPKHADPVKLGADWKVAEACEPNMKKAAELADELGILDEELLPFGHHIAKIDYEKCFARNQKKTNGKYIEVTAITPTPLGEGKTTTTMGLVPGLAHRLYPQGKTVTGAIRQPSGGPTFNIKGSAAGGGLSQCIPLTPFSLGLTGDIDNINNAHNLAMVALTSRMQHEFNYDDKMLKSKGLKRLDIDPNAVEMKWIIDFCAQALREIIIGIGTKMDGFMMKSGFAISVSSEIMAILAVTTSLKDLRERMGKIVVAYSKQGKPVTTEDLEVAGAMTAWMVKAFNPNLMQSIEGQPVFVHAGPFANIAVGQSSIVADKIALKLADYHVTESGFGADIGFEKFWNIKCRFSGLTPHVSVLVATIRALKSHGGGPPVPPGKPLAEEYRKENLKLVEAGLPNLLRHIQTIKKAGISPVVCVNSFYTDTKKEIAIVRKAAEKAGARCAVSTHWQHGGKGALEIADAVIDAANDKPKFKFLYPDSTPLRKRIEIIAKEVYGASGVSYSAEAERKAKLYEAEPKYSKFATCMVKTHLSTTHDPNIKGAPTGFTLPVSDILLFGGAQFIVPVAGGIKLMPGTASDPAYRRVDVDPKSGKVVGLF